MVTRAPFLTTRFGGYLHREVPEEDAARSHVGQLLSIILLSKRVLRLHWRRSAMS